MPQPFLWPQCFAKKTRAALALIAVLIVALMCLVPAWSQSSSGTMSGTVTDPSGAVIPNANVVLQDMATGVETVTVSNGTGFFSFSAVSTGTYKLTVKAEGFTTWQATGLIEHQGENHNVPNIVLPIGSTSATVAVTASDAGVIPLDNGASTMTLNSVMVDSLSIQGRDAAELVKLMPGMGMNTGLTQSQFNSQTTAETNSGPIGQFSANGTQPYGSMQMTLDGASLVDVGIRAHSLPT